MPFRGILQIRENGAFHKFTEPEPRFVLHVMGAGAPGGETSVRGTAVPLCAGLDDFISCNVEECAFSLGTRAQDQVRYLAKYKRIGDGESNRRTIYIRRTRSVMLELDNFAGSDGEMKFGRARPDDPLLLGEHRKETMWPDFQQHYGGRRWPGISKLDCDHKQRSL